MPGAHLTWSDPPSGSMLADVNRRKAAIPKALRSEMDSLTGDVVSFMQATAPWNDVSGEARAGLQSQTYGDDSLVGIAFFHTVFYGPFLEFGTYKMAPRPVLRPTQQTYMARVATIAHKIAGG